MMLQLTESSDWIRRRITQDLAEVESRFAAELHSDLACVNDLVRHIEQFRGKMLRPMLVLVSGYATRQDDTDAIDLDAPISEPHLAMATVIEMVHMATLVHDDILDDARTRRRGQTIHMRNGTESAVMLGDYLFSHAMHLCAMRTPQTAGQMLSRITNVICEGELLQLSNRNNWSLDELTYFEIIRRKTGSLVGVSCQLGAHLSQADTDIAQKLYHFGEQIGTAFQIVDDLLDITGDPQTVGKTLGRDVDKGKLTLPLIRYLETTPAAQRHEMLEMIRSCEDDRMVKITERLANSKALDYARKRARTMIERAMQGLVILPDSPAKHALLDAAQATIDRHM